ncbi:MAG: hypothetical protein QM817_16205 [Archangium sp.]
MSSVDTETRGDPRPKLAVALALFVIPLALAWVHREDLRFEVTAAQRALQSSYTFGIGRGAIGVIRGNEPEPVSPKLIRAIDWQVLDWCNHRRSPKPFPCPAER